MQLKSNQKLADLLSSAVRRRAERTLQDLFEALELPAELDTLDKLFQVKNFCVQFDLELVPSIERGDLYSVRCLRFRDGNTPGRDQVQSEIEARESSGLELKSSLLFDYQKAKHVPNSAPSDLKSEGVLHSAMKTIAAFLNSGGGILYVGVADSGAPMGIETDFVFLKEDKRNADSWELMLRDFVRDRFYEGGSVNDYIRVAFISLDNKLLARIDVASRNRTSFLKNKSTNACCVYRRQGNRTTEVPIEQLEEFIANRRTGSPG